MAILKHLAGAGIVACVVGGCISWAGAPSARAGASAHPKIIPASFAVSSQVLAETKEDYMRTVKQLMALQMACDMQDGSVIRSGVNAYTLYDAANQASQVCDGARKEIEALSFSSGNSADTLKRFSDGIDKCSTAAFARSNGFAKIAEGANSGMRPALASSAREEFAIASDEERDCFNAIRAAARDAGLISVKTPRLPRDDAIQGDSIPHPPKTAKMRALIAEFNASEVACKTLHRCEKRAPLTNKLMAVGLCQEWKEGAREDQWTWERKTYSGPCFAE